MKNLFHFEHIKYLNVFYKFNKKEFFFHKKNILFFLNRFLQQLRCFLNKKKLFLIKKYLKYQTYFQNFYGDFKIIHNWCKNKFLGLDNLCNHRKIKIKKLNKSSSTKSFFGDIRIYEKKQDYFKTKFRKKCFKKKKFKRNIPLIFYLYPKRLSSLEKSINLGSCEKNIFKKRIHLKFYKRVVLSKCIAFNKKFLFNLKKNFYLKKTTHKNKIFIIYIKTSGIFIKNIKRRNNHPLFSLEILIFFKKNQNIFYLLIFYILHLILHTCIF